MTRLSTILFASIMFAAATLTNAHTDLASSSPSKDAVVNAAPEKLELHFTEEVRLLKLSVTGKSTGEIATGFKPSADAVDHFALALPALVEDSYTVNWSVMGEDQHLVEKTFDFTIDADAKEVDGAAAPAPAASHSH